MIIVSSEIRWEKESATRALKLRLEKILNKLAAKTWNGLSLLMFSPICGTQVKERWSAWLTGRSAWKGEGAGSITWTQLLRLTTTIHHSHPPTAPRQPSHPHIWVGFPARSARHSVIPKKPLPAPIENLSGILKQPSLHCPSSSFLLHVPHCGHLWLEVDWPWHQEPQKGWNSQTY